MSTSTFPTSLDSFSDPSTTTIRSATGGISPAAVATLANDALAALEAKVGVNSSTVTTTLDYKVALLNNTNAFLTDSGAANAYILTPSPAITAYTAGQRFNFYPSAVNTGSSTLNVSGLGTKAIQWGGYALPANFLSTSLIAQVIYDGTYFQLQNPASRTLGYAQITTSYTTSSFSQDVPGVATTVNVPAGGARIKITVQPSYVSSAATAGTTINIYIREGVNILSTALLNVGTSSYAQSMICVYSGVVTGGSHTYKATVDSNAAGAFTFGSTGTTGPAFILVEMD